MAAGVTASPALAGGFTLEHQNAAALGRAFAGAEAERGEPAFAAYNPASIAGIANAEIDISATGFFPKTHYDGASGTLLGVAPVVGGGSGDGVIPSAVIPNITIAFPVTDRLTFGLVANTPFGLKTSYDETSAVRYQARDSELTVIDLTPVIALEVADGLAIGAGFHVQYADLSLTSTIDAGGIAAANLIPGFAPQSSDLDATFNGDDIDFGFSIGALADLSSRLQAGVSYHSKIEHGIAGDARFDLAGSVAGQVLNGAAGLFGADRFSTELATPGSIAIGARLDATDRLALLASGKRTFWSSFDVVAIAFNDGATPPEVVTQNWNDSWQASLGAEVKAGPSTTLRAGLMWDQSPVNKAFAHPRVPDGDRVWFAAGVSQAFGARVSGDLGIAYAVFDDTHFALDGAAPENLFRGAFTGNYEIEAIAVSGTLRLQF